MPRYPSHEIGEFRRLEEHTKTLGDGFSCFADSDCLRIQLVQHGCWVQVILMNQEFIWRESLDIMLR